MLKKRSTKLERDLRSGSNAVSQELEAAIASTFSLLNDLIQHT